MDTELVFFKKRSLEPLPPGSTAEHHSGYPTPRRPKAMVHCSNCTSDADEKLVPGQSWPLRPT